MSNLPLPRYSLWQAVSAALAVGQRAIEEVRALAREPGPQGERGERGVDGLGFDDLEKFEDELSYGINFRRGDQVKELRWVKPTLADFYEGVWQEGVEYKRGKFVTWGGSLFITHKDTNTKPGVEGSDWQLGCKRGRDGKDGKNGERGLQGLKGERGEQGPRSYGG